MAQPDIMNLLEPPDETAELDEDGNPVETPIDYSEEDGNLVPIFERSPRGTEALARIYEHVVSTHLQDYEDDERRRTRIADDFRVLAGELKPKEWPFKKSANAHVPFALESVMRLWSRLMQEIFGDWKNVFGVQPIGKDDNAIADVLTLHGNWQLRNDNPDFQRQMGRALMLFLVTGECISQSEYDHDLGQNHHETLTPDEFTIPSSYAATFADLSDLPRYSRIRITQKRKLQRKRRDWSHVDDVLATKGDDFELPIQEAMNKIEGKEPREDMGGDTYKLIQWDGWLDMPEYDEQRWCRVVVHEGSQKVLFLSIMEEPDWRDSKRFERQFSELGGYREAKATWDADKVAFDTAQGVAQAVMEQAKGELRDSPMDAAMAMGQQMRPEPMPPRWLEGEDPFNAEPEPVRMKQLCLNARAVCIENVAGSAGLGVGRILGDYNRAGDTMLSQYIDTATFNNCPGWLITGQAKFPEGDPEFAPGKFIRIVAIDGVPLDKAVMPIRPGPANQQLLEGVSLMGNYAQAAAQAPDVLSGAPGKSGETFRGHAARVEQASKQLTSFARYFCLFLTQVLKNNALLNAVYLPEHQMVYLLNDKLAQWQDIEVGKSLYDRDYRVEIMADLEFTSEAQRISEADQLTALVMSNPALAMNPAIVYEAVRGSLVARGEWQMVASLGKAPPKPEVFGMPPMQGAPGGGGVPGP